MLSVTDVIPVSIKCRLQTGYKMQNRYKVQIACNSLKLKVKPHPFLNCET